MKSVGEAVTPMEKLAEAAIAKVPRLVGNVAYEVARTPVASPVHSAVDGLCVHVCSASAGDLFLKELYPDVRPDVDVELAARSARQAHAAGVGPRVIEALPEVGIVLFEYLDAPWRTARCDDFDDETLARVLGAAACFHRTPCLGRSWTVFDAIESLIEAGRASQALLPSDLPYLADHAALARDAITASGIDLAPTRGDGVASNIMLHPNGGVALVDHDAAADADPWQDIAGLVGEARSFDDGIDAAIEAFAGRSDRALKARVRLYAFADDLRWGLWGLVSAARSPRTAVEFFKYGEWRLLRARLALNRWDFESWLRTV